MGEECRVTGVPGPIWISIATLQAFNNRINVARSTAVPVGKGSIEKRQKRIKRIID